MIYQATKAIAAAFDKEGIKYSMEEIDSKMSYIEAGFSGDNVSGVRIRFISTDDDNDFAVRMHSFVKGNDAKRAALLECVNSMNDKYRFVKFVLDDKNTVRIEYDVTQKTQNVGPIAVELFIRVAKISDAAYPEFMKALWA